MIYVLIIYNYVNCNYIKDKEINVFTYEFSYKKKILYFCNFDNFDTIIFKR